MESKPDPSSRVVRLHWGWFWFLVSIGTVITVLAFAGPLVNGIDPNALSVWQSILTNFGVGILSAAVLLLFEPKFRKVVTDSVKTATAGVKEEVREAVRVDVDERLGSLTDRINSLYDAKLADQEAVITDLATDFSQDRVMRSFREAEEVSALFHNALRVQAEKVPGKLHIEFQLRVPNELQSYISQSGGRPTEEHEYLHVAAIPEDPQLKREVIWDPDKEFAVVAMELAKELSRGRARGLYEKIDWQPVLSRLERGIKTAVDASNRIPNAVVMNGALLEVAGPDASPWYLADDGIYKPDHDWYLAREAVTPPRKTATPTPQEMSLEKPEWADQQEWEYILARAKDAYSYWLGGLLWQ